MCVAVAYICAANTHVLPSHVFVLPTHMWRRVSKISNCAVGPENPSLAVDTIQRELRLYKKELSSKPQILVASKMDIVEEEKVQVLKEKAESQGMEFLPISEVQQAGIKELKDCLAEILEIGSV